MKNLLCLLIVSLTLTAFTTKEAQADYYHHSDALEVLGAIGAVAVVGTVIGSTVGAISHGIYGHRHRHRQGCRHLVSHYDYDYDYYRPHYRRPSTSVVINTRRRGYRRGADIRIYDGYRGPLRIRTRGYDYH